MKHKIGIGWPHDVTKSDLIIEPVKGSGPGGQKRNKTASGIRLTHIPTGISVRSDEERMQSQNLKIAFNKLAAKLVPLMIIKQPVTECNGERIRTYNSKSNRVSDDRIEGKTYNYTEILSGNALEKLITDLMTYKK